MKLKKYYKIVTTNHIIFLKNSIKGIFKKFSHLNQIIIGNFIKLLFKVFYFEFILIQSDIHF